MFTLEDRHMDVVMTMLGNFSSGRTQRSGLELAIAKSTENESITADSRYRI